MFELALHRESLEFVVGNEVGSRIGGSDRLYPEWLRANTSWVREAQVREGDNLSIDNTDAHKHGGLSAVRDPR